MHTNHTFVSSLSSLSFLKKLQGKNHRQNRFLRAGSRPTPAVRCVMLENRHLPSSRGVFLHSFPHTFFFFLLLLYLPFYFFILGTKSPCSRIDCWPHAETCHNPCARCMRPETASMQSWDDHLDRSLTSPLLQILYPKSGSYAEVFLIPWLKVPTSNTSSIKIHRYKDGPLF